MSAKEMPFKDTSMLAADLVDRWLNYQTYIKELPGISVGIEIDGESVLQKSYGYRQLEDRDPATPQTLYRIASHSKLFTASAIMRLFNEGKLRLDDTAGEHLDWFSSAQDPNLEHITIRQLLSHSSGMNRDGITAHWDNDEFPSLDSIKSQTRDGLSSFDTLEHWKYSNMAFTILGQVIESVTGEPYEDAVRRLVLEPMGLENTVPDFEDDKLTDHATGYGRKLPGQPREPLSHVHARVMNSATGFSSSVEELLRFYRHHQFGNESFLPDRLKREMQRVQYIDRAYSWGLGFSVNKMGKLDVVGHSGGYPGFITVSLLCQEKKLTVVVLTNAIDGPASDLAAGIVDILNLADRFGAEITENDNDVDEAWLDDISGFYANRWGVSLFQRVGSRMITVPAGLMTPSTGAVLAEYQGDNEFRWVEGAQNGSFGESTFVEEVDGQHVLRDGEATLKPFTFSY
jgi:D-alanyl-D-alanine carboxypeptidase